ncbi:MAG: hypothetical protein ACOZE5_17080 [Verrucomicrobiota bacterium]
MKITQIRDWFLLVPPAPTTAAAGRLSDTGTAGSDDVGPQPRLRQAISFVAVFLGVLVSFYVTGLPAKQNSRTEVAEPVAQVNPAGASNPAPSPAIKEPGMSPVKVALVSLVITLLSYPAFYFNLKLYSRTPLFIVFCVAFQNGYFWHALIHGFTA